MPKFSIVMAVTPKGGIGRHNRLPWQLKQDLKHFKQITTQGAAGNTVIMGRKTWESIGGRPLPGRENLVISTSLQQTSMPGEVRVFQSLDSALEYLDGSAKKIFVLGGKQLIEQGARDPRCSEIHLTRLGQEVPCDVYVDVPREPFVAVQTSRTRSENGLNFDYQHLVRAGETGRDDSFIKDTHEEFQYLNMIEKIMKEGVKKEDRTGVGTISIFGQQMRFSLEDSFPLLTTKKVFFRGVVEELIWFMRGRTDGRELLGKKVRIWEGNGTRAYLDSIGLKEREEHDLGPIYGFQWRHFGAKYRDCRSDYIGQGVDQLGEVVRQLKSDPDSRRIILSAWNPSDLKEMALPPCHTMAQFYVAQGKLSCQMYQRSCDFGLGVPFNIASYSLLTCLLAEECNLGRGEFIHVLGDAHIYRNHVEQLERQVRRTPFPFPILRIREKKRLEQYESSDLELAGYQTHEKLEMQMAV